MPTDDEIAQKLGASLDATAAGLRQVLAAVEASGFAAATPGYREMRTVLLAQRLWSLRTGRHELTPKWREAAAVARRAAEALAPFVEVMQAIGRLDDLARDMPGSAPVAAPPPPVRPSALIGSVFDTPPAARPAAPPAQAAPSMDRATTAATAMAAAAPSDGDLLLLALGDEPQARGKLRAQLGWPEDRLTAAIAALDAAGKISVEHFGRGVRLRRRG